MTRIRLNNERSHLRASLLDASLVMHAYAFAVGPTTIHGGNDVALEEGWLNEILKRNKAYNAGYIPEHVELSSDFSWAASMSP